MDFEERDPIVPVLCETFSGVSYAGTSLLAARVDMGRQEFRTGTPFPPAANDGAQRHLAVAFMSGWAGRVRCSCAGCDTSPATQTGAGTGGRLDHDCLG